jgi:hypothetical protein
MLQARADGVEGMVIGHMVPDASYLLRGSRIASAARWGALRDIGSERSNLGRLEDGAKTGVFAMISYRIVKLHKVER